MQNKKRFRDDIFDEDCRDAIGQEKLVNLDGRASGLNIHVGSNGVIQSDGFNCELIPE